MTKHAHVKTVTNHQQENKAETPTYPLILPLPSMTKRPEDMMGHTLLFPLQLFFNTVALMMSPWRMFTPFSMGIQNTLEDPKSGFPKVASEEDDKEYRYNIELPGITHDQIALSFQNGNIMLRIERVTDSKHQHSRSLRRALTLPVYTNANAVKATLAHGMLAITIPKANEPVAPQPRVIEIAEG